MQSLHGVRKALFGTVCIDLAELLGKGNSAARARDALAVTLFVGGIGSYGYIV